MFGDISYYIILNIVKHLYQHYKQWRLRRRRRQQPWWWYRWFTEYKICRGKWLEQRLARWRSYVIRRPLDGHQVTVGQCGRTELNDRIRRPGKTVPHDSVTVFSRPAFPLGTQQYVGADHLAEPTEFGIQVVYAEAVARARTRHSWCRAAMCVWPAAEMAMLVFRPVMVSVISVGSRHRRRCRWCFLRDCRARGSRRRTWIPCRWWRTCTASTTWPLSTGQTSGPPGCFPTGTSSRRRPTRWTGRTGPEWCPQTWRTPGTGHNPSGLPTVALRPGRAPWYPLIHGAETGVWTGNRRDHAEWPARSPAPCNKRTRNCRQPRRPVRRSSPPLRSPAHQSGRFRRLVYRLRPWGVTPAVQVLNCFRLFLAPRSS